MGKQTAVCFVSKYGTTEKYANIIARQLGGEALHIGSVNAKSLAGYDRIIIGSPVFAGRGSGKAKKFCEKNKSLLMKKEVGAYLCCMAEGDEAQAQLTRAYPQWLLQHSNKTGVLGGEVILSKLSGLHKMIITKMIKQEEDKSMYSESQGIDFAKAFA